MSLNIRLARAGTKKRPVYHVVVADSRSPRDGRFIERLGYFNPLLPKEKSRRLKLDIEKAKVWSPRARSRPTACRASSTRRASRSARRATTRKRRCRASSERRRPKRPRRPKPKTASAKSTAAALPAVIFPAVASTGPSASPDRRAAWRARRGQALDVHRRSAGGAELRPAGDERRRASV